MVNWLQWGTEWQTKQRKLWTPQPIFYQFTNIEKQPVVYIPDAMVGQNRSETEVNTGLGLNLQRREFVFETKYLLVNPANAFSRVFPQQGDQIKWKVGDLNFTYSVEKNELDDDVWRWHDRHGKEVRVFTQKYELPEALIG